MEVNTFADDLLDLSDFANRLYRFIEVERQFVDGSLVVALSAKFGSGKTTFLKMWKTALEETTDETRRPLVFSLNAWESDYNGEALFAIVSKILECMPKSSEKLQAIVKAVEELGWFMVAASGQVVSKVTGIDPVAAAEFANTKIARRGEKAATRMNAFSDFQNRKAAMTHLQSAIREFVESSKPMVLFLVDELDRCRPDYAISYLETIKHVFDIPGAVFVLAADRSQLENSARATFGRDLDFSEYYRRFVKREVALPPISELGYKRVTTAYVDEYLEREGLRTCFMKIDGDRIQNINELVIALKFTPRQLQEVFRIVGHALDTRGKNRGQLRWCLAVGTIAMASLKIARPKEFELLGTQRFEPKEAYTFLTDLLGNSHVNWWFTLFATGGGIVIKQGQSVQSVMQDVGILDETGQGRWSQLAQWEDGWGDHSRSRLVQTRQLIEQVANWD